MFSLLFSGLLAVKNKKAVGFEKKSTVFVQPHFRLKEVTLTNQLIGLQKDTDEPIILMAR